VAVETPDCLAMSISVAHVTAIGAPSLCGAQQAMTIAAFDIKIHRKGLSKSSNIIAIRLSSCVTGWSMVKLIC
jgi:hypothetical protein